MKNEIHQSQLINKISIQKRPSQPSKTLGKDVFQQSKETFSRSTVQLTIYHRVIPQGHDLNLSLKKFHYIVEIYHR